MKNHICFRFVGAAILLLMLSSCKDGKEGNAAPKYYQTEVLAPVSRTGQVQFPALLKGRQSVEIRPQCSGLITRICIEEGACVKKGQILFVIDQAPYLAALKTASAFWGIFFLYNYEIRLKAEKLVLEGGLSIREAGCHLGCGRSQVRL